MDPVDLRAFREWLEDAGAEGLLAEFLTTFRRDAPSRLAALERAATAEDLRAVERAAHAYRSAAVTIFAVTLAEKLARVELAGAGGDLDVVSRSMEEVRHEHSRVMASLHVVPPEPAQ
jgi:HPt (histidine-containing phosphotransfer) domain-containing protein